MAVRKYEEQMTFAPRRQAGSATGFAQATQIASSQCSWIEPAAAASLALTFRRRCGSPSCARRRRSGSGRCRTPSSEPPRRSRGYGHHRAPVCRRTSTTDPSGDSPPHTAASPGLTCDPATCYPNASRPTLIFEPRICRYSGVRFLPDLQLLSP